MKESPEIKIMRHMAWHRAKGELEALLATFCENEDQFSKMQEQVKLFTDYVEDNGLYE